MSQRAITFHYTLKDKDGVLIDSSLDKDPFTVIEGAGQIIPGLEKQLIGLSQGDRKMINVPAEEAYGVRNEAFVVHVPRAKLPSEAVKIGDKFRGGPDHHAPVFTVVEIQEEQVTLDANHPLAGKSLDFEVQILEIRDASAEELEALQGSGCCGENKEGGCQSGGCSDGGGCH